jgi:hypothetical protein
MFRDLDDTIEQVWGSKRAIYEFKDWDDTHEQVWKPKRSICEKSEDLNGRFTSLGTEMTRANKFEDG